VKPLNTSLLREAREMLNDSRVSATLNAQCEREVGGESKSVNTAIHPDDQMLTHSIRMLENVNQSVSQYFCVALQQYRAMQRMLDLAFPQGLEEKLILDFACGYGRALRFLVQSYPAKQIWASDIQEDAVTFVKNQFNVNAIVSDAKPEKFQPGRKFQFIWVASLFTHLPEHLFRAWLVRLYELLTDDGYLVFSVHDESILPPGRSLAANGFLFKPESEISELDSAVYGTTHVSESYVRSVFTQSLGHQDNAYLRIPRGLADQQDLYVLPKTNESLERFSVYRQGPWGWVEHAMANGVSQDAPTVLAYLSGWAKSLDQSSSVESVYAEVDGVRYQARLGIARPDIAQVWGSDFVDYGWEIRFPISRTNPSFVNVFAELSTSERGLIYLGILEPQHLLELAPWGYLDSTVIEGGFLILGGWAAASRGRKIINVSTKVNGTKFNASLGEKRQDVCDVLADQGYLNSGWHIHIPADKVRKPVEVQIVAEADDGESKTLYKGLVLPG
jgi:SAM-dependent methyltransferase